MNLEAYRTLFMVVTLGLAFVAASPLLSMIMPYRGSSKEFSEFWLLGPDHMAEGYPFDVGVDETYRVFIGIDNHMGGSEYHKVSVKFRSSTQSLPDISSSEPSSLSPLYEYLVFVGDGEVWESPETFGFQDVSVEDDVLSVGDIIINDVVFPVDASVSWDSENNGFFFQLFFELWRYDMELHGFRFHERFVGIWLNMTSS